MKMLLLAVLLCACGKKEPKPIDLNDTDSDGVRNAYESPEAVYVADVLVREKIEGTLTVTSKEGHLLELPFSTQVDLNDEAFRILATGSSGQSFLSEFSVIHLVKEGAMVETTAAQQSIQLSLSSLKETPKEIYLLEDGKVTVLETFASRKSMALTSHQVQKLMKGEIKLGLGWEKDHRDLHQRMTFSNYRLLVSEEGKTQVKYVARGFNLEDYMTSRKMSQRMNLDHWDILKGEELGPLWWFRRMNQEATIMYATSSELKAGLLSVAPQITKELTRTGGQGIHPTEHRGKNFSRVYLLLREPAKINHIIEEKISHKSCGHEGDLNCTTTRRFISGSQDIPVHLMQATSEILITIDGKMARLSEWPQLATMKRDEKGEYLEAIIEQNGSDFRMELAPLAPDDVVFVKEQRNQLKPSFHSSSAVHTERKYSVKTKAYLLP